MEAITVKEAFEKAGYPIPDGVGLYCRGVGEQWFWWYSVDHHSPDFFLWENGTGWVADSESDSECYSYMPITNLPVADCVFALPEEIKTRLRGI